MRGGRRPGAGRKKGSINKANALRQAMVAASGETPLDALLSFMRAPRPVREKRESGAAFERRLKDWQTYRFEAARAAASYVHPKLAAVEHRGDTDKWKNTAIEVRFVSVTRDDLPESNAVITAPPRTLGQQRQPPVPLSGSRRLSSRRDDDPKEGEDV